MSSKKIKRKPVSLGIGFPTLTPTELDIIKLLQSGKSDEEIAEILSRKNIIKAFQVLTNLYKKINKLPQFKEYTNRLK